MIDIETCTELVKYTGFPALIFVMWYLYHKSTVATFDNIVKDQSEREERNFELLKGMLDTNQYNCTLLATLIEKIENNQWCPYVKSFQGEGQQFKLKTIYHNKKYKGV